MPFEITELFSALEKEIKENDISNITTPFNQWITLNVA